MADGKIRPAIPGVSVDFASLHQLYGWRGNQVNFKKLDKAYQFHEQ
jgi:hypothetical protein